MERIRFAVAGCGWRALFYVRAAQLLPERFELTGVLCRTAERAQAFAAAHGVPAFAFLDDLLATRPSFVVSCVSKGSMTQTVIALLERGMPALSETPLATDMDALRALHAAAQRTGTPLALAEQYFLYPTHQARRAILDLGLLGDVTGCTLSMMHDYHAVSMLRRYLGEERGEVRIRARRIVSPIAVTGGRGGYVTGGEMGEEVRVLAEFAYADGRLGLYDFASVQYHSAIRSSHVRILGTRGEIFDDEVRYLDAENRPQYSRMEIRRDAISGAIRAVDFEGRRVYANPLRADVPMTEDEIAVCCVLLRMDAQLKTGEPVYPLAHGFLDSEAAIKLQRAAATGNEETVGGTVEGTLGAPPQVREPQ